MERTDDRTPQGEPIQPDPQLQLSQGRATGAQIALVAIACMLIVAMMIYGLNQPVSEGNLTAAAPPAQETTAAAPPAERPAPQTGGNVAGSRNAAPSTPASGGEAAQPAKEPVPRLTKPGAVEDDSAR